MTLLFLYVFAGFIAGSITTFALFYHYEPGLVTLRDNYKQQLKQASEAYNAEALRALRRYEQESDDDREAYLAALERDRHELGLDLMAKIDQAYHGQQPDLTDRQKLLFLRLAGTVTDVELTALCELADAVYSEGYAYGSPVALAMEALLAIRAKKPGEVQ